VRFTLGGGAGYGDPKLRRHELIEKDIADDVLSIDLAHRVYGYCGKAL